MAGHNVKVYALLGLVIIFLTVIIYVATKSNCPKGTFCKGAVAADNVNCSKIGLNILIQGGSAVDAAIAALLCTSIMNPQSAGIGGGAIFTIMDKSGKVTIINSRETAPSSVKPDLLKSCAEDNGSKWIGVPGEIRGYELAHKLYGKLNWKDLFTTTIKLAREGFHIPLVLYSYLPEINETESLRKLFSYENGTLKTTRDIIKFEKLADTLELIANKGPDAFYNGSIAEDLQNVTGGNLTLKDFESYNATVTDAWVVNVGKYKEYKMYIPPPPSGGPLLSFVLNFMTAYKNEPAPQSVEFYDRYIKALKRANKLKKCIRDPNFAPPEFEQKAKEMTTISAAENIQDNCTLSSNKTDNSHKSTGTTHVSAVDQYGTFVAVTSSINSIFGSKVYSPNTGIILNNQLLDFCNRSIDKISPGERPPSSMAPVVLQSKSKTLAIGASGGSMITTGIASALINHLWFGKSLKEAIDARVVYVDPNNKANLEPSFDNALIKELEGRFHELGNKFYNVVNAVEKKDGCISAESDDRKLGKAAGY
ncbi:gamma-glutamyltransferase 5-like isoform X1 [Poecilia formosa]|uniref:Gamma-glutamyltransferase 5a n=2 Tax=Poecilia formosa TaxID=48698 RepID=A0A087Y6C3_POEFO|nr:PREDICTED: gamma-glutamyltransferase 5-like isoform X1 [Poecilia formosa]